MKSTILIGIALALFGIFALAYGGVSWTRRDKVVEIGSLEVTTQKKETWPVTPLVGIAALAAGGALMLVGLRK